VLRPQLPTADRLLSYLRRIDRSRTYTNWGPLAFELESRLGQELGLTRGCLTLASSGTAAIVAGVLAAAGRVGSAAPLAIVPAYTFVATPLATEQCGYQPYLVDIEADSWTLQASSLERHRLLAKCGVVVPVAPFGRGVPQAPWVAFRKRTGIPVVIDGGASFEAISADPHRFIGPIPVALSFHATKSFSTAEGGCVVTTDADLAARVGESLNFGFAGTRDCNYASINGKMSEYHAAIGLAALDGWADTQRGLRAVAETYRTAFDAHGLISRLATLPQVAGCYAFFHSRDASEANRVVRAMAAANIETRFWYGAGLHHQPYFRDCERDELAITDLVAPCVLALPVAVDLSPHAIARVVNAVAGAVSHDA
jgi:dTDP-4-amino-4,6-dideoxygalactose transaminase